MQAKHAMQRYRPAKLSVIMPLMTAPRRTLLDPVPLSERSPTRPCPVAREMESKCPRPLLPYHMIPFITEYPMPPRGAGSLFYFYQKIVHATGGPDNLLSGRAQRAGGHQETRASMKGEGFGVTSCGLRPPGQQVVRATTTCALIANANAPFSTSRPTARPRSPTR
jgi:hypothetical protein